MIERNDHDMTDHPATSEKDEMASEISAAALHDGTPSRCPPYSHFEPTPPTASRRHTLVSPRLEPGRCVRPLPLECHGRRPTPRQPIMPLAHNRHPWHACRPFPELHGLLQIPNFP
jgi:hypothetical protein